MGFRASASFLPLPFILFSWGAHCLLLSLLPLVSPWQGDLGSGRAPPSTRGQGKDPPSPKGPWLPILNPQTKRGFAPLPLSPSALAWPGLAWLEVSGRSQVESGWDTGSWVEAPIWGLHSHIVYMHLFLQLRLRHVTCLELPWKLGSSLLSSPSCPFLTSLSPPLPQHGLPGDGVPCSRLGWETLI